jgi:hypothetical protein
MWLPPEMGRGPDSGNPVSQDLALDLARHDKVRLVM